MQKEPRWLLDPKSNRQALWRERAVFSSLVALFSAIITDLQDACSITACGVRRRYPTLTWSGSLAKANPSTGCRCAWSSLIHDDTEFGPISPHIGCSPRHTYCRLSQSKSPASTASLIAVLARPKTSLLKHDPHWHRPPADHVAGIRWFRAGQGTGSCVSFLDHTASRLPTSLTVEAAGKTSIRRRRSSAM